MSSVTKLHWGDADGRPVYLFTMTNARGDQVRITNFGAAVVAWYTRDNQGRFADIVLGFDSLSQYLKGSPYFGAIVGRYGNRIGKARFELNGQTYTLAANNGENHLHGGHKGFDKVVWDAQEDTTRKNSLLLTYLSKDMEEGYPGNLTVVVRYTLTDSNALEIEYKATTDKATVLNLTNHSYFNLSGDPRRTILDEVLQVNADHFTAVDADLIPTGEVIPVKNTPFDFTTPMAIRSRLENVPGGYDINLVLSASSDSLAHAATVTDPPTGRRLDVYTTEPGIQFYTGNFLDSNLVVSGGIPLKKHVGLCLETQHFPDSPNKAGFPSVVLEPGQTFHSETIFRVSVLPPAN